VRRQEGWAVSAILLSLAVQGAAMTLASAALRKLIDGLAELYEPTGAGDPEQVIRVVTTLIDADSCSYNEFRGSKLQRYRIEPAGVGDFPDGAQLFQQHLPEHPVLAHCQATGDGSALRISDFLSDRQFRALGLYRDFYRQAEVGYQLTVTLPGPRRSLIGIALNRRHTDFSAEDREMLNLLRPHIGQVAAIGMLLSEPSPLTQEGTPLLTPRQSRVVQLVSAGYDDRSIGRLLGISPRTVHTHLQHVYRALGVTSRTEALAQLRINAYRGDTSCPRLLHRVGVGTPVPPPRGPVR
jgi:DNA-binding CsgD family transcriptional regulator